MRVCVDIECNGFVRIADTIHCIVMQDLDTGEVFKYDDTGQHESLTTGVNILSVAEEVWGHNLINFDYPVIKKIYPFFKPEGKVFDTLILSRLFFQDMLQRDFRSKPPTMPASMYGKHSLESWGHRLGQHKSEYGKSLDGDWSTYTPQMLDYCVADVAANVELCRVFEPKLEQYKKPIYTEMQLAKIMAWQEEKGIPFDSAKAHKLESTLRVELEQKANAMKNTFREVDGGEFTPARDNKTKGYVKGATFCRLREFNPTSRSHIAWAFQQFRQWEPNELTDTGRPKIDEKTLTEIGTEEAMQFARILELQKALGQLSEGQNAWLKLVTDGRIHHSCVLNTNTGRNIHMRPNLAQTNSAPEYRALFGPGEGRVMVGADAKSLELRVLGHYLARYDSQAFAKEVVEGDIHTKLCEIYKTSRSIGKSVTYAMLYGGSNYRIGLTAKASKDKAAAEGKRIRKAIMDGLDGFAALTSALAERAESDVLTGLDGRPIRLQGKKYAATNYLCQSAGSCVTKSWVIRANELLQEAGIDYYPLLFIHDEMQLSVKPEDAERAAFLVTAAIKDVEHFYKFRCELDAEAQIGATWADCH